MTNPKKLEKLFAVVVLAFLFNFAWGCRLWREQSGQTAGTKRKSLFRLGLKDLLNLLHQAKKSRDRKLRELQFYRWLNSDKFEEIFLV